MIRSSCSATVHSLEPRRLLSLNLFGEETTVPGSGLSGYAQQQVAVADDGSYLTARIDLESDLNVKITAARYNANGKRLTTHVIASFPRGENVPTYRLSASMDADGDAVIAYSRDFEPFILPEIQTSGTIHVVRLSRAGVVSTPELVADGRVAVPAISMDDSGGYYLAWIRNGEITEPIESIQGRAFNADGTPRGPRFQVMSNAGQVVNDRYNGPLYSGLTIDSSDDGSSAAFALSEIGQNRNGAAGRFDVRGEGRRIRFSDSDGQVAAPSLALRNDGSFAVVLQKSVGGTSDSNAILRIFDANVQEIGLPIVLRGLRNADNVNEIAIDATPSGFIAAYSQVLQRVQTVYVQEFDPAGNANFTEPAVVQSSSVQRVAGIGNFSIATDDSGQSVFTYEKQSLGISTGHYRRLTSGVAAIDKSVLWVFGTSGSEEVWISDNNLGDIRAQSNAGSRQFERTHILTANINGFGRHDLVSNDTNIPATIRGGAGNDTIRSSDAADVLQGGDGNDILNGGVGDDSLQGENGDDTLYGNDGADALSGNAGNDRLLGGPGLDGLRGHGGDDTLIGGNDDFRDYLYGGDGNDNLNGGPGIDSLFGDQGDDLITSNDGVLDTLFGGTGQDRAIADEGDRVSDDIESILYPTG